LGLKFGGRDKKKFLNCWPRPSRSRGLEGSGNLEGGLRIPPAVGVSSKAEYEGLGFSSWWVFLSPETRGIGLDKTATKVKNTTG